MTEIIKISTEGSFSLDELKSLLQCIRDIEQNDKKRHIDVFINCPEKTMVNIDEINDSVDPQLPYRINVPIQEWSKMRECDTER